jgi:hypothetical protein
MSPMSPRTLRPRQTLHPEAADWAARVVANGGSVSGSTLSAVDKFCKAITSAGIRDRFYRLNLFCGTGLNACLVPLYRGQSQAGTQYGNTVDTNIGPFVGGDYNETGASGGLLGNGSSKYLSTGLTTAALPSLQTGHVAAYAMTGFSDSSAYGLVASFSSGFDGSNYYGIEANAGGVAGTMSGSWGSAFSGRLQATAANGAGIGLVATSRIASDDNRIFRNGSQIGSTQTAATSPAANSGAGFGVFVSLAQAGSTAFIAPVRMGGYSIGAGMTAAQMASYNTAMQAFQSALSRNV